MNSLFWELINVEDELENKALELNKQDDIALCKLIGRSIIYDSEGVRVLHADQYMDYNDQITFSRHPHYVNVSSHKHDFLEMTYVYKGNYTQIVNNRKIKMSQGDIFILDTYVVHEIEMIPDDCILINVMMKKEYFIDNLLSRLSENNVLSSFIISALYKNSLTGNYLLFHNIDQKRISYYIEEIVIELSLRKIGWQESVNSLVILLSTEILRKNSDTNYNRNMLNSHNKISIIDILNFINKNFIDLTLVECANKFAVHPNYLTRLLKKYTGKTFLEIIQQLKLENVINLLCNTNLSIVQILDLSGFSNSNHFYQLFKKNYGCTPKEFRLKNTRNLLD